MAGPVGNSRHNGKVAGESKVSNRYCPANELWMFPNSDTIDSGPFGFHNLGFFCLRRSGQLLS